MAYLNYQQEELLKTIIKDKLNEAEDANERNQLSELMEALNKDDFYERTKEDVVQILNDHDVEIPLTEEELNSIIEQVIKYDYSDYNNLILELIQNKAVEKGII